MAHCRMEGLTVGDYGGAVLEARTNHDNEEPFTYQLGHTIPAKEGSKLLSPHSRMLSHTAQLDSPKHSLWCNYKYTKCNPAYVSSWTKVITPVTSIRGHVMIVKSLRWVLLLPYKRSCTYTYGTVLVTENLTSFWLFPSVYYFLLIYLSDCAYEVCSKQLCSHYLLNFSLKQTRSKYKTHKVGFASHSYDFLSSFYKESLSKTYYCWRNFIILQCFLKL